METNYGGEYKIKVSDVKGYKSGNHIEIAKAVEKAISEALKGFYSATNPASRFINKGTEKDNLL
jgi:hypothetical protein